VRSLEARPYALALAAVSCALGGCKRGNASTSPPEPTPSAATITSASTFAATDDAGLEADVAVKTRASVDVVFAGDAIAQVKVLANDASQIMAGVPSCWTTADARVLNLESPIGERKGLPGDKTILAFAMPSAWFQSLYAASHASAFVFANNHACDLGPQGLADTVNEAGKISASVVGAASDDPWKRIDVVEKDGRHVCVVAWTTFLNDKGRKQKGCLEGEAGAKVARAELGRDGLTEIHKQLSAVGRWDGCDARVAYIHGGREYKPQIRPVLEQAQAAAAYVDAVIVSHPHVPDVVEPVLSPGPLDVTNTLGSGGRKVGRSVPVFRSLGNFISNQGIGWSLGMSVDLLDKEGVPDPIRTVWTRVAMLARLRFGWEPDAPAGSPPTEVKYGYTLVFTERSGPASLDIRMRALPNAPDDPVATKLRKGPKPFSLLLDGVCRVDPESPPKCDGLGGASPSPNDADAGSAVTTGASGTSTAEPLKSP
jgi:poly-gamma-glutamate capsule biosynthesis protein CapA/YwtB (metallophosphatase superfamily)